MHAPPPRTPACGSGTGSRVRSALAAFAALAPLAVVVACAPGCSGKGSQAPNAQSVERQSEAEYQLAVDLFEKGNVRAALDHTTKAIALNEDNDKAQYFGAVISGSFCMTNRGVDRAGLPPRRDRALRPRGAQGEPRVPRREEPPRPDPRQREALQGGHPGPRAAHEGPGVRPSVLRVGQPGRCAAAATARRTPPSRRSRTRSPSRASASATIGSASPTRRSAISRASEASFTSAVTRRPGVRRPPGRLVGPLPRPQAAEQRRVEERLREVPGHLGRHAHGEALRADAGRRLARTRPPPRPPGHHRELGHPTMTRTT